MKCGINEIVKLISFIRDKEIPKLPSIKQCFSNGSSSLIGTKQWLMPCSTRMNQLSAKSPWLRPITRAEPGGLCLLQIPLPHLRSRAKARVRRIFPAALQGIWVNLSALQTYSAHPSCHQILVLENSAEVTSAYHWRMCRQLFFSYIVV